MTTYTERYPTDEDKEYRRKYMQKYMEEKRSTDPKYNVSTFEKRYRKKLKIKTMEKLGGLKCSNCGCDVLEILEINHIYGNGRKEMVKLYNKPGDKQFYRDILSGKLNSENYNVLCRVCNAQHYVEQIKGIKGHKIIWN